MAMARLLAPAGGRAPSTPADLAAVAPGPLYLPSVVLAGITGWFVWAAVVGLHRTGELRSTVTGSWAELAGPAVFGFVLAVMACERLWPAEGRKLLARGHLQDGCFFILFVTVMAPFVTLLGVTSASLLHRFTPWLSVSFTAGWPRWMVIGITLVAMDGCNWVAHLADHRVASLWRVHALHHSQEELSVLTTFRVHPLVHTVSFVTATVPVVALMDGRPIPAWLITLYLCLGALPHANVAWSFGPLGRFLVSPSYHRIHHSIEGPVDVNLGIVFVFWDVLARRAVFPEPGAVTCRTGLAGRPYAVEQASVRSRPAGVLVRQMLEPFWAPLLTSPPSAHDTSGSGEGLLEGGGIRLFPEAVLLPHRFPSE